MTGRNQSSPAAQLSGWAVEGKVKTGWTKLQEGKTSRVVFQGQLTKASCKQNISHISWKKKKTKISTSNKIQSLCKSKMKFLQKNTLPDYFFNDFKSQWSDLIFKFHFESQNGLCQQCNGLLNDSSSAVFWDRLTRVTTNSVHKYCHPPP